MEGYKEKKTGGWKKNKKNDDCSVLCVCTFLNTQYMAINCLDYTHGNHFIKEKKALLRKAGLNDLSRAV